MNDHAKRLREMAEQHDKYAARWATHPSITSSPVAMRCKKLHEDDAAALRAGAEALEREIAAKAPKSPEEMARSIPRWMWGSPVNKRCGCARENHNDYPDGHVCPVCGGWVS